MQLRDIKALPKSQGQCAVKLGTQPNSRDCKVLSDTVAALENRAW